MGKAPGPPKATKFFGYADQNMAGMPEGPPAEERGIWAKNLPLKREQAGFKSAASLAAALGTSDQNVRNWENGRAGLSPAQARQLAAFLRCDWRELYGEADWLGPSRAPGYALHFNGPLPFQLPDGFRPWQHFGDTLTARAILSGDLIGVDGSQRPADGDLVLATVAEVGRAEQRDFFAVRAGRYLIEARAGGPAGEPVPMEGPGIAVRGTGKILFRKEL